MPQRKRGEEQLGAQAEALFRAGIPSDELGEDDWEALRVAIRLVYETEALRASLKERLTRDRNDRISDWSDSLEAAISLISWVRQLGTLIDGAQYPASIPQSVAALWRRHRVLASRLTSPRMAPPRRWSLLVELGAIEITLWGHTWALEPMYLRDPGRFRRYLLKVEPDPGKRAAIVGAIRGASGRHQGKPGVTRRES